MMIQLIYLKSLEIMNTGTLIMYSDDSWRLPHYEYATIVGQSMHNMGWFVEETRYINEWNNIKYYKLSEKGLENLKIGREWYNSLSLWQKIYINIKIW